MVARAHFPPFDTVDKKEDKVPSEVDVKLGGKSGAVYLNGWYTLRQLQAVLHSLKGESDGSV